MYPKLVRAVLAGALVASWSPCGVARAHTTLAAPEAPEGPAPTTDQSVQSVPSVREEAPGTEPAEQETLEPTPPATKPTPPGQKTTPPPEKTAPSTDDGTVGVPGPVEEGAPSVVPSGVSEGESSEEARPIEGAETTPPSLESPGSLEEPLVEAAGDPITLEQAIDLALRNHPAIAEAEFRIDAAKTRVGQEQAAYYPQIDGWLEYVRATENGSVTAIHSVPGLARVGGSTPEGVGTFDSFNNYLAAVIVRQMIYDSGRTKGAVDAQRAFAKVARVNQTLVEQTVVFGVMQAYYDVWAARASVELARENEKTALAILELAIAAHDAGLKPESEPARAEAAVASARVAVIQALAQLEAARARVANAVGQPEVRYEPTAYAVAPKPVPPMEELVETALNHRPELEAFDYRRDGLEHSLRSIKAQQYPRIDGILGVNSRGQFLTGAGQEPFQRFNWHVGVVINVPMFQGLRVRKQKQELTAQMRAVDEGQDVVRQAVVLEIRRAVAAVRAADAAARASAQGVDAARRAVEILEGRYPEGLAELVELTDAQNAYIQARTQQVRATYDRFLARAALSLAIGKPKE